VLPWRVLRRLRSRGLHQRDQREEEAVMGAYDKNAKARLKRGLAHVPDEYLRCRDLLHSWVTVRDFTIVSGSTIERSLVCSRCGTLRYDSFTATSDGLVKDRSRYSYPQDYQLVNVPRGVKPGVFVRGELFRRHGKDARRRAS
jgi:hypothetical protein